MKTSAGKDQITILFVIGSLRTGGAERQLVELVKRLPPLGFRPVVAVMEMQGELIDALEDADIPIHSLDAAMEWPVWNPFFWTEKFRIVRTLREIIRKEKVQIVHAFLFWASIFASFAAKGCGVPCITGRRSLGWYRENKPSYLKLERYANRSVVCITANSRGVLQEVLDHDQFDPQRAVIIYNGVELDRFASTPPINLRTTYAHLRDAKLIVGAVGNIRPIKGYDTLIEALAITRDKEPGLKAIIAGADREDIAPGLVQKAHTLGVYESLVIETNPGDVASYFGAFDFQCLPSDSEGFPNVVLEGMAAGLSVVATNAGGTPEAIVDGETGFLVPPKNPRALAEKMLQLARDPELRKKLGANARRRVGDFFTMDAMVRAHARLYRSILATGAPPRDSTFPIISGGGDAQPS